jgi:hypothetical protein
MGAEQISVCDVLPGLDGRSYTRVSHPLLPLHIILYAAPGATDV